MTLLSTARQYSGRIINLDVDTVGFPDGSSGQLEMIRHPGASAVVPFLDALDAPDPRVLLLRQFRHAAGGYLWEVPAGRLDPGETPDACARRELREEAGHDAGTLRRLTAIYTTPGFTDEVIHLFAAHDLTASVTAREADEFMEVHTLRWSEVGKLVASGAIQDGKTLVSLMFVQCCIRKA
ncbi:MAG: NUDIX hydrolase [Gemmatimonadales bacterium]|nr:NUDIX hydrolase [Gemmatimonadales bacterium]